MLWEAFFSAPVFQRFSTTFITCRQFQAITISRARSSLQAEKVFGALKGLDAVY